MIAELKALLLQPPRLTLAVAESVTAGHVQARVASVSGATSFFVGGITAYSLEQKVKHLGVDRALAEATDCVAPEIAEQMARGVCRLFGADVGIATTGYAEPSAERGVNVPYAWWALAVRARSDGAFTLWHGRVECAGASRVQAQTQVADAAVAELVARLQTMRAQ